MTGEILTLDIATRTGFAYGVPGSSPTWGSYRFAPVGAGEGVVMDRAMKWFDHQLDTLRPSFVYAEDQYLAPPGRPGADGKRRGGIDPATIKRLWGLRGICVGYCERYGVPLRWVPATRITSFFTAFGRWPKGEKKAATIRVCRMYGWPVGDDDDAADALALFLYAEHDISPRLANGRSMGTLFSPPRKP